MATGILNKLRGQPDAPPPWATELLEKLHTEKLARLELAKQVNKISEEAQAAVNLLAEQLNAQEARHAEEIERLAGLHKTEREQLLERISKQQGFIEFMNSAAQQSTMLAMTQYEAVGQLQEGLRRSEKGGEKQGERIGRLEQEVLTSQRQTFYYRQIAIDAEDALAVYEPDRPRQVPSMDRLVALPPPIAVAPAPEEVAPHE